MKFSVRKMTSVTLLASMMLTTVSPPMMPVLAQETETEMASSSEVETEMEIACIDIPLRLGLPYQCSEIKERSTQTDGSEMPLRSGIQSKDSYKILCTERCGTGRTDLPEILQ